MQWDPSSLDKVEDEKLNLVFQPFEEDLELQIPEKEECRYTGPIVFVHEYSPCHLLLCCAGLLISWTKITGGMENMRTQLMQL